MRPTGAKVREAIFSRLFDQVRGARVLDLFAGSGALAIEALSRGAAQAIVVDQTQPRQDFHRIVDVVALRRHTG